MKTRYLLAIVALAACNKAASEKPAPAEKPVEAKADDEPATWENEPSGQDLDEGTSTELAFQAWVSAQQDGDFDTYIASYAPDFVGVRRSPDGTEVKLDLAKWTKERKKMFSGGMQIAAENPVFDGPTVTFLQRYRRGDYADHGLKVLTFDTHGEIVAEEMLWTMHGWDDHRMDAIDARAMTSPFTLRVAYIAGDENGDCVFHQVELTIEDSSGQSRTVILGETIGLYVGEPVGTREAAKPKKGASMYRLGGGYCGGLGVEMNVKKVGDALVTFEDYDDEEATGDGRDERVAVLLPPGAEVIAK